MGGRIPNERAPDAPGRTAGRRSALPTVLALVVLRAAVAEVLALWLVAG